MTPFPRTFIIKSKANNGQHPPFCHFPILMTPFLLIAFINEEATGCINKEAIGAINEVSIAAIITERYSPSSFFTSCFTFSLAPSINRPDFLVTLQF